MFDRFLERYDAPPVALRSICSLGSGSQGTNTSSQQSSSGPPAFLQPYLQQGIGQLAGYYANNPTAPSYYSGETVAPLSPQSQGAVSGATSLAGSDPIVSGANSSLLNFINGSYVNPNTNPDFQGAIAASQQPVIDAFNHQVLPGIESTMEGAGRYGSGETPNLVDQATKTLGTTLSNAATLAGSQYYTNALGQEESADAVGAPNLNTANWQNVSGLGAAGTTVDQQRQAQDTSSQAAYNYNANAQPNYISQYLAMLNGGYPGGETNSTGTTSTYQPQNTFSSLLGGGLGLAGLGLQAYSAFSDERLKEDISEPIGKTFEGIPIRLWRYKGDAEPRVGFIAQEVAEHRPEAVDMHPSGFLTVNYRAATGPQGLF